MASYLCSASSPGVLLELLQQWRPGLPQKAQQQQVKQPCQPPPVRCQETCAPQTNNPCAPQPKKQCPPKGTVIPTQHKCPMSQQAPKNKQK
ncbi:small proline-rich protein 4 [Zalophus californianus]|uniref:Small proline-rich protein 4 n=1 Tax=Zalophus californianus TaxID=9704 RepID=A0A6J2DNU1_ZALCA|nr:small proline-rich protein 4 [Zalophus californianus]